jgi:hypothetical protein
VKSYLIWIFSLLVCSCAGSRSKITLSENWPAPVPASRANIGVAYGQEQTLPFPEEVGYMLADDHSLSIHVKDNKRALWFSQVTKRGAKGVEVWKVLDVLDLSIFEQLPQTRISIAHECLINGKADVEIFGIPTDSCGYAKTSDFNPITGGVRMPTSKAKKAWRADRAKERISEIPLPGVECFVVGCGDY